MLACARGHVSFERMSIRGSLACFIAVTVSTWSCTSSTPNSGTAGAGGTSDGGAGAFGDAGRAASGAGGHGGNHDGQGAAGEGGTAALAGAAGEAGEAGAAGQPADLPSLGQPCRPDGQLACNGPAQKLRLHCVSGTWQANGTCAASENCAQSSGLCAAIVAECDGRPDGSLVCGPGQELERCGTDSVTAQNLEACVNKCVSTASGAECAARTWALWPMPNPASSGLPHPASYDTSTAGVVTDRVTGLMWQAAVSPTTYTWADAKAYCGALVLAGHSDWRLPSRIELVSLVDFTIARPGPTIDASAFPNAPSGTFWTASTRALQETSSAWYVLFDTGFVFTDLMSLAHSVRCVR